ncbi:hypothetical protein MSAN_02273400 [Mycena sanguinolenta]|uniref:Protein kinase domain-containing protein n=1 Tax=Mycena sanguinolenta TaxID=230812 RepID=A0A8H7CH52_9AGAR|nr:hypothetical protein MSAN_02273400 [Mycena sanguinolenta]
MDLQADSEAEFIVVSTSDYAKSPPHSAAEAPLASGLTRNAKLFVDSIRSLPSFLGGRRISELQNSETSRTYARNYPETIGMRAVDRLVTNNYYISGGVGGSGGDARGHGTGGEGGAGHGPTVYLGEPRQETLSPFRTIRLGDLDLIKEIRLDERSNVVGHQSRGAGVRRMYSANLVVRESERKVTVAMYQGDGAELKWQEDHTAYESIRHPNILQLYGLVNTKKLCAMVFQNELIPYHQFLRHFEHSPILITYILGYCRLIHSAIQRTEWQEAADYHSSNFPMTNLEGVYNELPLWIQPATGQLCVDLSVGQERDNILLQIEDEHIILRSENISLHDPNAEALVISSVDKNKYHELCSDDPLAQSRMFSVSSRLPIEHWMTLCQLDFEQETLLKLTKSLDFRPEVEHTWNIYRGSRYEHNVFSVSAYQFLKQVLPNSWTRYDAREAYNLIFEIRVKHADSANFWLSQANYIFSQLQTTSDFKDYVLLTKVIFDLRCRPNPSNSHVPEGYLFVCPAKDFRTGENSFKWPDCPAYWSLDPSGAIRLTSEDAETLGFPIIHIETCLSGYSWDESVYQGLRQFHAGKGFNSDNQDMARDLGYPLFELSSEEVPPLEYAVEEDWWCESDDPARCQALGHYI